MMIPQQQKIIQHLHTRASKIQLQLSNQISQLRNKIMQSNPHDQSLYNNIVCNSSAPKTSNHNYHHPTYNNQHHCQQQQHFPDNNPPYLTQLKHEISTLFQQYQKCIKYNTQIQQHIQILHELRRQIYEEIIQLKSQLTNNKYKIQKSKKYQQYIVKLQQQYKAQVFQGNKLSGTANHYLKFDNQINSKISSIQQRQHLINAKLQQQKQSQLQSQTSELHKNSQQWNKLLIHLNTLKKQTQHKVQQNITQFTTKQQNYKQLIHKIQSIDSIYEDINIVIRQQQYIIMQIMIKQQITPYQINYLSKQQHDDKNIDLSNNIISFRQHLGINTNHYNKYNKQKFIKNNCITQYHQLEQQQSGDSDVKGNDKIRNNNLKKRINLKNGNNQKFNNRKSQPIYSTDNYLFKELPKINGKNHRYKNNCGDNLRNYQIKCRESINQGFGGMDFNYGFNKEIKVTEFGKGVRIRTKHGYKYYGNNSNRIATERSRKSKGESSPRGFVTQPEYKDPDSNGSQTTKNRFLKSNSQIKVQHTNSSMNPVLSQQIASNKKTQYDILQRIKLSQPRQIKKYNQNDKLQMQSRQSDNQNNHHIIILDNNNNNCNLSNVSNVKECINNYQLQKEVIDKQDNQKEQNKIDDGNN